MLRVLCSILLLISFVRPVPAQRRGKPAPPPSRYTYTLTVDPKSLPEGVKIRESNDDLPRRLFISNASDKPLVIDERDLDSALDILDEALAVVEATPAEATRP